MEPEDCVHRDFLFSCSGNNSSSHYVTAGSEPVKIEAASQEKSAVSIGHCVSGNQVKEEKGGVHSLV